MAQRTWNTEFVKTFKTLAEFQAWNNSRKSHDADGKEISGALPDAEITKAWNDVNPAAAIVEKPAKAVPPSQN